jgi:hypothetical protein
MPTQPPPEHEIVVATGFCCVCDYRFRDELVLRFREPVLPGGWGYIELRHLDEPNPLEPEVDTTSTAVCAGQRRRRASPPTAHHSSSNT